MAIDLNGLRGVADAGRKIATPIRTTRITVRRRTWPSQMGLGTPTLVDFALPAWIKVVKATNKEVASSGGRITLEDVLAGPISPSYPGGGVTIEQLAPTITDDLTEVVYVLSGAIVGEYTLLSMSTERPFRYMLTLRRKETTP
jgi:hypothetical protein